MFSLVTEPRWIAAILNPRRRCRPSRKNPGPCHLELECLEDRTVPTAAFVGNEFQIASGFLADNTQPAAVAMDGAGDSLVVWGNGAIMAQAYDANATPQGQPILIQPYFSFNGRQMEPSVAMDAAGNYVVAWYDSYHQNVLARRYDAAGVQQGADIVVAATNNQLMNPPNPTNPAVVLTPTGFTIFWDGNDSMIHGNRYGASANLLGTIAIPEAQAVRAPKAAVDAAGNFVVVYSTVSSVEVRTGGAVLGQRIDANGSAVGSPFSLSVTTASVNLLPAVSMQPDGDFATVWASGGDTTGAVDSATGMYVRFFNADATAKGAPILLGPPSLDGPIGSIATDGAGNYVVTWAEQANSNDNPVEAQLFDASGTPHSTAFQVDRTPAPVVRFGDGEPVVTYSPTGNYFLIAFNDNNPVGPSNLVGDLFAIGPNHAPVVDVTVTAFTFVKENNLNPAGDTVGSVVAPAVLDQDLGAFAGVAVTGLTGLSNGIWQYSLNGGTSWVIFGAMAENAALLLRGSDMVRFIPNTGFLGSAKLTFHAWDQSTGAAGNTVDLTVAGSTGGSTAFSTVEGTATMYVTPTGNYAPVLDPTYAAQFSAIAVNAVAPAGNTVAQIVGPSITDRNAGDLQGIAVTAATGSADGTWQYSLDGGTTWTALPVASLSLTSALLLRATDMVRFVPNREFTGSVTIGYHAWDQTQGSFGTLVNTTAFNDPIVGAAGSPFSAAQATATAAVTRFILTGGTLDVYGTPGNDTFSFVAGTFDVPMTVTLNGETHQYQGGISTSYGNLNVNFHSGGGADTANIDMSYTSSSGCGCYTLWGTAIIGDGFTTLTKAGGPTGLHSAWVYTVNLFNTPKVYLNAATGDVVTMMGSTAGPNKFVATPTYSYLVGPGSQFYVVSGVGGVATGYASPVLGAVYAYGNHAAGDQAYFYGSGGMDAFVASGSAYSYLSGTSFFNVAAGFGNVQMLAAGGQAIAYFLDSPGNDSFYGSAASCYMSGPGYINAGVDFAMVYAESFVGGTDYAYNLDPAHVRTAGFAGVFYP